jgi:hypothetical protein
MQLKGKAHWLALDPDPAQLFSVRQEHLTDCQHRNVAMTAHLLADSKHEEMHMCR